MADLGTDVGNSTLSMSGKIMEAVLRIFELLFRSSGNAIAKIIDARQQKKRTEAEVEKNQLERERLELEKGKAQRAEAREIKDDLRRDAFDEVNGAIGYVNHKTLKASGVPLHTVGVDLTPEQMRDFGTLCKREGVLFSSIKTDEVNEDGTNHYTVLFKKEDLGTVGGIVERMNKESIVKEADKKMEDIKAKGDEMTEQDKVDLEYLAQQKEDAQKAATTEMNDKVTENVIESGVSGKKANGLSIDEALNHYTGRAIDKDRTTVIADARDPDKYIICQGQKDIYNDKEYTKTEYEVIKNGESVLKTHDGRFDGRPETYWQDQKDSMMKAGEFSGTFLKFDTVEQHREWADRTKEENNLELSKMQKEESKDYDSKIQELESQLDRNGAMMKDGEVVSKETGQPLAIADGMSVNDQLLTAESVTIGRQIETYKELKTVETERSIAEVGKMTSLEDSEEHTKAKEEFERVDTRYQEVKEQEKKLLSDRKEINAMQKEQEVRSIPVIDLLKGRDHTDGYKEKNAPVLSTMPTETHGKEKNTNYRGSDAVMTTMPNEILGKDKNLGYRDTDSALSTVPKGAIPDDRRSEIVNDMEEKQVDMEGYNQEINKKRQEISDKAEGFKDAQVHDMNKESGAKSKSTNSMER